MRDTLKDNQNNRRFEMEDNGQTVFADYRKEGECVYILHVEAPPNLRGTGAAGKFMVSMMEYIRVQKLKAVPVCSYAAAWLAHHREFKDIISER